MPGLIQCGVGCQLQSHCCLYCPQARRKVLPDRTLSPPTCQASAQGCTVPMGGGSAVQVAVWPGSSESWVGLLGPLWFAPSVLDGPVQVEGQGCFRRAGKFPRELSGGLEKWQVCGHWEWALSLVLPPGLLETPPPQPEHLEDEGSE